MAYKKYIRRNGKLYGPYLYESKRVDGKVVSEYHGSEESSSFSKIKPHNYKKIFFFLLGIFFVAVLIQFIFVFSNTNKISGKAIFEMDSSYKSGEPIDGVIKLSLSEGEFLPASSKIVFENSGKLYEFTVSEIIEDSSSQGNYYIKGKEIQGFGEGYGIPGEQVVYPELNFNLQVYQESNENELNEEENLTEETFEEVVENEATEDEDLQEIVGETSLITGNSIKESRGVLGSLFGVTGMVSLEFQDEIVGKVSKDKPFVYELKQGEKVELKHGSVYFGEEELSDEEVSLEIKDNVLSVTTDYFLTEEGYGNNYIGEKKKTFSFDLSELNIVLEEGELDIKIVYEDQEIVYLNTLIESGEKISEEVVEIPEQEVEEEINEDSELIEKENFEDINSQNETVEEVIDSSIWDISDFLTDEEKKIILDEFGDVQLKNVNSELFKGRIIRVYEIGEYSVEYSYDSSLNQDVLEVQMERDRIKFLKDIAASISNKEALSKPLAEFQNNYTF